MEKTLQKGQIKKKKERETNGSERCKETDKGRENWWLHWVKMPKYLLKRQGKSAKCHRLNMAKCYANTNSEYTIEYTKHIKDTYLLE